MSIRSHIDAQALNHAWTAFERCAEDAPEGAYEQAKAIAQVVGLCANHLIKELREIGLGANNGDGLREVEAVIYGYIKNSNPDAEVFPMAEGFGSAMVGEAGERVLAQAVRDRDFLQQHQCRQ
jgi:hypothetical protein